MEWTPAAAKTCVEYAVGELQSWTPTSRRLLRVVGFCALLRDTSSDHGDGELASSTGSVGATIRRCWREVRSVGSRWPCARLRLSCSAGTVSARMPRFRLVSDSRHRRICAGSFCHRESRRLPRWAWRPCGVLGMVLPVVCAVQPSHHALDLPRSGGRMNQQVRAPQPAGPEVGSTLEARLER